MPDSPSVPEQIASILIEAQDHKHRQRYYLAITKFLAAERLIIDQLPSELRDGADDPSGPARTDAMRVMRSLFVAGARLAKQPERSGKSLLRLDVGNEDDNKNTSESVSARSLDRFSPAVEQMLRERGEITAGSDEARPAVGGSMTLERLAARIAELNHVAHRDVSIQPLSARLRPEDVPVQLGPYYFADIPLGIGECLVQLGQDYDRALGYYSRAENYPFTNPPFTPQDLWLRLAELYLTQGDAAYRSDDKVQARANYENILKNGEVPSQSRLYGPSLSIMVAKVRSWLARLATDPAKLSTADFPPQQVTIIATVTHRLAQLDAGLDFLGNPPDWTPVLSFAYLRETAKGFAQFAAQANREYVAYTQRAEDQTQTIQQLEQTVVLGDAGIQVDMAHQREVLSEIAAAGAAESLAATRAQLAQNNYTEYKEKGWDIARLDEASAWANAAASSPDDETKQTFTGLSDLGVSGDQRSRSDLVQLLAAQRNTRSYEIERDRLNNAVVELDAARQTAHAQTQLAGSRLPAAQAAINASLWRNQFARVNLAEARSRETFAELFFDLARLSRDTAQIYLQRAISVARAMEQAYNFENNTNIKRIRIDYGDLSGAGNLYAADFLLRDIDSFVFESITSVENKSQLIIRRFSLRTEFPSQYAQFLQTGKMVFQTTLDRFHLDMPGTYNGRIKRIAVDTSGLSSTGGVIGFLTSAGVASFRTKTGEVVRKVQAAETMLLPPLSAEKGFAHLDTSDLMRPTGELAVFENGGLQSSWQLELPLSSNDFQLTTAADIGLVIAYFCQHDLTLDTQDREHPPTSGEAQFWCSMRDQGRDDTAAPVFGRLETNSEAAFVFPSAWLPRNFTNSVIQQISIFGVLKSGAVLPMTLRFFSATNGTPATLYRSDADGIVRVEKATAPGAFHDASLSQTWRIGIDSANNPQLAPTIQGRVLDLSKLHDIIVLFAYAHGYR